MTSGLDALWPRYQAGEIDLNQVFEAFDPVVQGAARWLHKNISSSRFDIDDLMQEGRIGLFTAIERYEPEKGAFSPWCRAYITNRMKDYLRSINYDPRNPKRPRETVMDDPDFEFFEDEDDAYAAVVDDLHMEWWTGQVGTLLDPHIAKLNERQQLIVKYRYQEGLSMAEISDRLGSSKKSISAQHRQAIKNLRGSLEGVELPT